MFFTLFKTISAFFGTFFRVVLNGRLHCAKRAALIPQAQSLKRTHTQTHTQTDSQAASQRPPGGASEPSPCRRRCRPCRGRSGARTAASRGCIRSGQCQQSAPTCRRRAFPCHSGRTVRSSPTCPCDVVQNQSSSSTDHHQMATETVRG